jgi:hypothetical protein
MIRLLPLLAVAFFAGCIDSGPPTYQLDASWTANAHATSVADSAVSVTVTVKDPSGDVLDYARVDGYDGQYQFQLTTAATSIKICATPEYLGSIVVEPPPWCSGTDCQEYEKSKHWPIGDAVCKDLVLGDPQLSTTLALGVYNPAP